MPVSNWSDAPNLRREDISFDFRGHHYLGHLVAPAAEVGPRPLVLVVHLVAKKMRPVQIRH